MKFSKDTLTVLKNFGSINDGIVFRQGNTLRTCDASKQVLAEATVAESIPSDFAVFDLNRFLSIFSLYGEDVDLQLSDRNETVQITKDRLKTNYRLCDITMIKNAPEKSINMPSSDVSFNLSAQDFELVMRSASALNAPHISVSSDGAKVFVNQLDSKNTSAHSGQLEIAEGSGRSYNMIFKTENLKMIPGNYEVNISFKGIANFKNKDKPVQYWVATEIGSSSE